MEPKEITMLLDVKLEAKEKNFELLNLRVSNSMPFKYFVGNFFKS